MVGIKNMRYTIARCAVTVGILVGVVLGLVAPSIAHTQSATPRDYAAVRQVLYAYERAWNDHDAHAFAATFSPDADFTNVRGVVAHGRAAIEQLHAPLFAHMFHGSHQVITSIKIRFLSPDIAAVEVLWDMTGALDHAGAARPLTHGLRALVLTKEHGTWGITVFHNMELLPPIPAHDTPAPPAQHAAA